MAKNFCVFNWSNFWAMDCLCRETYKFFPVVVVVIDNIPSHFNYTNILSLLFSLIHKWHSKTTIWLWLLTQKKKKKKKYGPDQTIFSHIWLHLNKLQKHTTKHHMKFQCQTIYTTITITRNSFSLCVCVSLSYRLVVTRMRNGLMVYTTKHWMNTREPESEKKEEEERIQTINRVHNSFTRLCMCVCVSLNLEFFSLISKSLCRLSFAKNEYAVHFRMVIFFVASSYC